MKHLLSSNQRRRALGLGLAVASLVGAGCPLTIHERCEADGECAQDERCFAGECLAIDGAQVGSACGADLDCGPGLTCATGFPGGYCVSQCSAERPCPGDSRCVPELGRCLRPCGPRCDRVGYGCVAVPMEGSSTLACAPMPAETDGGLDAGGDGGADAGCPATQALGQACQQSCQCLTPSAGCDGACYLGCATDFACPADRRCESQRCVTGLRLGASCAKPSDCPSLAHCDLTYQRCDRWCANDLACPEGYRCAPDGFCIEACDGAPATLGLTCETSPDCARCGYCVDPEDGGAKRCRQRCLLDRDCPDGGLGACEELGEFRACAEAKSP